MHIPHQGSRDVCGRARGRLGRGRGFIGWQRNVWELLSATKCAFRCGSFWQRVVEAILKPDGASVCRGFGCNCVEKE